MPGFSTSGGATKKPAATGRVNSGTASTAAATPRACATSTTGRVASFMAAAIAALHSARTGFVQTAW